MNPNDNLSIDLRDTIGEMLTHLKAQMRVADVRLSKLVEGGFDEDLAKASAALSRALTDLCAELRQLEKHDKRMTLTPEQRFAELVKYLRTLDPLQRKEVSRELAKIERER